MELRVELSLTISNKMAIPLVVPAEYGPLPQNNNGHQYQHQLPVQAQNRAHVDRNNNHVLHMNQRNQPDLLNRDDDVLLEPVNNQIGFLAQLIMELWTVFSGEPARQPRLAAARNRDNQRQGLRRAEAHPLPDLVQCHGLILDLSFESRRVLSPQIRGARPNQPLLHQAINDNALPPLTHDLDEDEESWSFGFKLSVTPWRETGRDLRLIADQFQVESLARRRTSSRGRSLEFRLIMKMALPTMVLVGLGFSYIRRHL